jgi:HSP20 family protein
MVMTRWSPWPELRSMQERMERLLEMSRERSAGEPFEQGLWQPAADVYEDEREVVIKLDLPEVDQEDIDVRIEGGVLIVQGVRHLEQEERPARYQRIEREHGPFKRVFALPASVDPDRAGARCDRGVLKIILPKKPDAQSRQIEISVG